MYIHILHMRSVMEQNQEDACKMQINIKIKKPNIKLSSTQLVHWLLQHKEKKSYRPKANPSKLSLAKFVDSVSSHVHVPQSLF